MMVESLDASELHRLNVLLINNNMKKELNSTDLMFYMYDTSRLVSEYSKVLMNQFIDFFSVHRGNQSAIDIQLNELTRQFISIVNKYIPNRYQIHERISNDYLCPKCGALVETTHDGYNTCTSSRCGYIYENIEKKYIAESYSSDSVNVNKKTVYKEYQHYSVIFDSYHGDVKKQLGTDVRARILADIKLRYNSTVYDTITPKDLKAIFKHIRGPNGEKYYNYIPQFYTQLTGKPLMDVRHMKDVFMQQFNDLLNVWEKRVKGTTTRNSFLSSHYVLYQSLIKNGFHKESEQVILLKSHQKKVEHDNLYRQLCAILHWNMKATA